MEGLWAREQAVLEGDRITELYRRADWFEEDGKILGQAFGNCICIS